MQSIKDVLKEYKKTLAAAQAQHQKTIEEATAQFDKLMAAVADATERESEGAVEQPATPQSAWITGNDNERFLMLNEAAAVQINNLFEQLKEVIELLVKREGRVSNKITR